MQLDASDSTTNIQLILPNDDTFQINASDTLDDTLSIGSSGNGVIDTDSEPENEPETGSESETETESKSEGESGGDIANGDDVVADLTDEQHDDVENILANCDDREMIFELLATDPVYYLSLIQNYKQTRDGTPIYLTDLLNIKITRNKGRFAVKFKFNDNDRWEEVGYMNGNYSDQDVYDAFQQKVKYLISHPSARSSQRQHMKFELEPSTSTNDKPKEMVANNQVPHKKKAPYVPLPQKNQYRTTKIDRFLTSKKTSNDANNMTHMQEVENFFVNGSPSVQSQSSQHVEQSQTPQDLDSQITESNSDSDSDSDMDNYTECNESDNINSDVLQSSLKQLLLQQIKHIKPTTNRTRLINNIKDNQSGLIQCLRNIKAPAKYRSSFNQLLHKLSIPQSSFVQQVAQALHLANGYQLPLLYTFIENQVSSQVDECSYSTQELIDLLELDVNTQTLVNRYKINLRNLWESC